jgi:hypothetical protein
MQGNAQQQAEMKAKTDKWSQSKETDVPRASKGPSQQ